MQGKQVGDEAQVSACGGPEACPVPLRAMVSWSTHSRLYLSGWVVLMGQKAHEPLPYFSWPPTSGSHLHLQTPIPPWYQGLGSLFYEGPSKALLWPCWALVCAIWLPSPTSGCLTCLPICFVRTFRRIQTQDALSTLIPSMQTS